MKVCDVVANSQEAALAKVVDDVDLYSLFDDVSIFDSDVDTVEYAEEINAFLVDERGDAEYENTTWWVWQNDGVGLPAPGDNQFRKLSANEDLRYVQRPYKDLDVPYELSADVRKFLYVLLIECKISHGYGRAFYTFEQYLRLGNKLSEMSREPRPVLYIAHDTGHLHDILDSQSAMHSANGRRIAERVAQEHGFQFVTVDETDEDARSVTAVVPAKEKK